MGKDTNYSNKRIIETKIFQDESQKKPFFRFFIQWVRQNMKGLPMIVVNRAACRYK